MINYNEANNLKVQHERAVGDRFIDFCNKNQRCNYIFQEQSDPPKPDLIYRDSRKGVIGIEITNAYYDNDDAKAQWEIARKKITRVESEYLINFDLRLIQFINDRIDKKCNKSYDFNPIILLIPTRPPLTNDEQDFSENILSNIILPKVIPFYEIYINLDLLNHNQYFKIYRNNNIP